MTDAMSRERPWWEDDEDEPRQVACWRCGKLVAEDEDVCPYCRANLGRDRAPRAGTAADVRAAAGPLKVVLWFFAFQLGVAVAYAAYLRHDPPPAGARAEQERWLLQSMLVIETIDTLLVLAAVGAAGAPPRIRRSAGARVAAWVAGAPVLALLLGINILYGQMLQALAGQQPHLEVVEINFRTHFWLVLLAVCVQPAVVEELFFRYLALGQLRRVMGNHGAVWVSAVMFGMAHLYNPLGMPVLIVVGAGLGYMRVASGGMALPVLMHGFHNAVVVALDGKL
jgi:membrane protease YdiL (CAAX protease family)